MNPDPGMPPAELIRQARRLAAADAAGLRAITREHDPGLALASALGQAQSLLAALADALAARLGDEDQ